MDLENKQIIDKGLNSPKPSEIEMSLDEAFLNQPTLNIGTIGHVAHGKSTLVKRLSGVATQKHGREKRNNGMTIKLGYANCKIWQCSKCPKPECFATTGSKVTKLKCKVPGCKTLMTLARHVSFVDCPGHEYLMTTMLNGAAVMDAALLIISARDGPRPQTKEHLSAVDLMGLKNVVVCQNKIDLLDSEADARRSYQDIKKFVEGSTASQSPILPISAHWGYNTDALAAYIVDKIPKPNRDTSAPPLMTVVRSFDINRPGTPISKIRGGVAGGSLQQGTLQVGQIIEIRPGLIFGSSDGKGATYRPLQAEITSLLSETTKLKFAVPGGLIGVGLTLDPSLTREDRLLGHSIGLPGKLPPVFIELEVSYCLLRRVVGADDPTKRVAKLRKGEVVTLNIGSMSTQATIVALEFDLARIKLMMPCCCNVGDRISISRKIEGRVARLIGFAIVLKGSKHASLYTE